MPRPRIEGSGKHLHPAPRGPRRRIGVLKLPDAGGDCEVFPHQPFPDVPVAGAHGADPPAVAVGALPWTAHGPPADLLDERALDPSAVPKPTAAIVARPGVPFLHVEAGDADLPAIRPDPPP